MHNHSTQHYEPHAVQCMCAHVEEDTRRMYSTILQDFVINSFDLTIFDNAKLFHLAMLCDRNSADQNFLNSGNH